MKNKGDTQIKEMHKQGRVEGSRNFKPLLLAGDKHSC